MADPASTIGIVAAAFQFFDFSIKLYRTFQEVRRNAESATEQNERLETDIRNHLTSTRPEDTDPHTTRCTSTANELLKLLEHVRGSGEQISSFRAFARAIRKRKDIEKLGNSFKEDQAALNRITIQKLPPSIDRLGVQQSVGFTTVNNRLDGIDHGIQLQNDVRRHNDLLEELKFPEINKRLEEIKPPATETLNWLFESSTSYSVPYPDSYSYLLSYPGSDANLGRVVNSNIGWDPDNDAKWPNFRQWLREDASTYWISGKAGSGKSTLMAYILDDPRTHEDLAVWSNGYELVVLQFFFWRAGSESQKSIPGLLRSLLYQLCNRLYSVQPTATEVIDRISDTLRDSNGIPVFTEKNLRSAIVEAVQFCDGFRFCIFIDGLDEFLSKEGSYDDLVDCVERLQSPNNVKICVSSRPELDFVRRFQGIKTLRLQDLNQPDIEKFVKQSLEKASTRELNLTAWRRDIVRRAEGVFLWASLVTQSLVDGIKHSDSEEEIQTRLDELPDDIDMLYERMISGLDERYMSSLAFYVQIMKASTESPELQKIVSLSVIAVSQLSKEINSYEEFVEQCELTKTRIISRSAGLLEISHTDFWGRDRDPDVHNWKAAVPKFISNQPRFTSNFEQLNRRKCDEAESYSTMLKYEYERMTWVHRSAYEYLTSRQLIEFSPHEDRLRQLAEAAIGYAVAAPSFKLVRRMLMAQRLDNLFLFIRSVHEEYPTMVSKLLDRLYSVYKQCDPDELHGTQSHAYFKTSYSGEIAFWSDCALCRCWSYMYSRMDCILKDAASDSLLAHLLACSIYTTGFGYDRRQYADPVEFIDSFAEHLHKRIIQRFEIGGSAQATKRRYISEQDTSDQDSKLFWGLSFGHAAWNEPVTDEYTTAIFGLVLSRLVSIIIFTFKGVSSTHKPPYIPASFPALMDATDLYVAPNIALKQICIHISGKAWITADFTGKSRLQGNLGSVIQVNKAIRILCVPTSKCLGKWEPDIEPGCSQPISLQPSATTSGQLLSIIGYRRNVYTDEPAFYILPDTQQQRDEVCNRLIQEIILPEQGLNEDQQRAAISCVQTGLLDPDVEARGREREREAEIKRWRRVGETA
ncbi:hypothetical protein F4680DRAFT_20110 [Xylaria scruposa]|nr:hypothetical protein F4680DRAFT_20110 [Xylaria scruposa]